MRTFAIAIISCASATQPGDTPTMIVQRADSESMPDAIAVVNA